MKKREQELYNDPWDRDFYETGSTRPPKNRGGLIAAALIAVILLCNATRALGIINLGMLIALTSGDKGGDSLSLFDSAKETQAATEPTADEKVTLELADLPEDAQTLAADEAVYHEAARSLVCVTCGEADGSGVVMSEDGYIITNAYLITPGQTITVTFDNGIQLEADLVGLNEGSDVAVLRVRATGLIPAQFGDSEQLRVGDQLLLIGADFRSGSVFAINEEEAFVPAQEVTEEGMILVNGRGQVVAIQTVPGTLATADMKQHVEKIIADGTVGRACLELEGSTVSDFDRRYYGLPRGVLISAVTGGGCADDAGLRNGDVITEFDGSAIKCREDLTAALEDCVPGDCVNAVVYRQQTKKTMTFTIILSEEEVS